MHTQHLTLRAVVILAAALVTPIAAVRGQSASNDLGSGFTVVPLLRGVLIPFGLSLTEVSWTIDQPPHGSLTLSGRGFSAFGLIDLVYNWGGGFYRQIVRADSHGSFTVTQGSLACGDIPGHSGVGVIVTATEVATGKNTTANFATPCQ
jgi:hypothetical protein